MQSTPMHERHNQELLELIPAAASRLVEVGCSSGALAAAVKRLRPDSDYLGVEIDADYAEAARRHCDDCLALDIEVAPEAFWEAQGTRDCWIFGDTLEHLRDPWAVLARIRDVIPDDGAVVACIPNAQHWSVIARLACGEFRYEDSGLLDRTHLRWFTRKTIVELFDACGFRIEQGGSRAIDEPAREAFLPLIGRLAEAAGDDPQRAMRDATIFQYLVRARPVPGSSGLQGVQ